MNLTAIPPLPTAGATILVDPERTSPIANTPRRLSASRRGGELSEQVDWHRTAMSSTALATMPTPPGFGDGLSVPEVAEYTGDHLDTVLVIYSTC